MEFCTVNPMSQSTTLIKIDIITDVLGLLSLEVREIWKTQLLYLIMIVVHLLNNCGGFEKASPFV